MTTQRWTIAAAAAEAQFPPRRRERNMTSITTNRFERFCTPLCRYNFSSARFLSVFFFVSMIVISHGQNAVSPGGYLSTACAQESAHPRDNTAQQTKQPRQSKKCLPACLHAGTNTHILIATCLHPPPPPLSSCPSDESLREFTCTNPSRKIWTGCQRRPARSKERWSLPAWMMRGGGGEADDFGSCQD